jgi:hypothetical protein
MHDRRKNQSVSNDVCRLAQLSKISRTNFEKRPVAQALVQFASTLKLHESLGFRVEVRLNDLLGVRKDLR